MIRTVFFNKLSINSLYKIENSLQFSFNSILKSNTRQAGHSHWQNVKQTKDSKDRQKSSNATILTRLVLNAIKEGDGIRDPKINTKLAAVIDRAKALNVPMSTLEKLLLKNDIIDPYFIEFQAPGGIFLVVESCNKHTTKERTDIISVVKKYGFKSCPNSILNAAFKYKGEIACKPNSSGLNNEDEALEMALEVGAEEVLFELDSETEESVYKFICNPMDLKNVQSALSERKMEIIYSENYLDPINKIKIESIMKTNVDEMIGKIRNNFETVHRIFINVE